MNDIEMIGLAAKAAGYKINWMKNGCGPYWISIGGDKEWNPIIDDSDAFGLAVKLKIDIEFHHENVHEGEVVTATKNSNIHSICCFENTAMNANLMAATRRAIVRVAVQMGEPI